MLAALALALAVPSADARIAAAEARLAALERDRAAQRAELAAAQAPLARLLGAIERLALRPPTLALAHPGSIDDMVHAHALLAALRPAMAQRTASLRAGMARTRAARAEAARTLAAIGNERSGYEKALGARLMNLPPFPAPPAATSRGIYQLPTTGEVVSGTGERGETGWRARGLTLLTGDGARVVAPGPGRILYAGAFGGYGEIVILDHGRGWTTLLAGLAAATPRPGTFVDRGAVIGRMGEGAPRLTIELRHNGRPIDVAGMAAQ